MCLRRMGTGEEGTLVQKRLSSWEIPDLLLSSERLPAPPDPKTLHSCKNSHKIFVCKSCTFAPNSWRKRTWGKQIPSGSKTLTLKRRGVCVCVFCAKTQYLSLQSNLKYGRLRESSRTPSEPPGSYELSASRPCFKGSRQESSHTPGGSDAVRALSREPTMFQIGL